ncbi:hypothetical protein [Kitasatospora sp. NPDC057198]|uniref:hypothetical protein n=1 Tax=Kitasatospora sp. NPDC057198 TaxID=3346046 RepID=UPI003635E79D
MSAQFVRVRSLSFATIDNGGAAAGIVGISFHRPYPGSAVKSWSRVLRQVEGRRAHTRT